MTRELYLQIRELLDFRLLYEYYNIKNEKEEFSVRDMDHFMEVFDTYKFNVSTQVRDFIIQRIFNRVIKYLDSHFNIHFLYQGNQLIKIY